jgi:hypothetical protein
MAMNTKLTAGAIVHVVSMNCPSNMNRLVASDYDFYRTYNATVLVCFKLLSKYLVQNTK